MPDCFSKSEVTDFLNFMMRVVANMLLTLLKQTYPVFFEDIMEP